MLLAHNMYQLKDLPEGSLYYSDACYVVPELAKVVT